MKSGKYEKFWQLSKADQAWLVATIETRELLSEVVAYVAEEYGQDDV